MVLCPEETRYITKNQRCNDNHPPFLLFMKDLQKRFQPQQCHDLCTCKHSEWHPMKTHPLWGKKHRTQETNGEMNSVCERSDTEHQWQKSVMSNAISPQNLLLKWFFQGMSQSSSEKIMFGISPQTKLLPDRTLQAGHICIVLLRTQSGVHLCMDGLHFLLLSLACTTKVSRFCQGLFFVVIFALLEAWVWNLLLRYFRVTFIFFQNQACRTRDKSQVLSCNGLHDQKTCFGNLFGKHFGADGIRNTPLIFARHYVRKDYKVLAPNMLYVSGWHRIFTRIMAEPLRLPLICYTHLQKKFAGGIHL